MSALYTLVGCYVGIMVLLSTGIFLFLKTQWQVIERLDFICDVIEAVYCSEIREAGDQDGFWKDR